MSGFIHRMDWWGCNTFSGCFVKKEVNGIIDQGGREHLLNRLAPLPGRRNPDRVRSSPENSPSSECASFRGANRFQKRWWLAQLPDPVLEPNALYDLTFERAFRVVRDKKL